MPTRAIVYTLILILIWGSAHTMATLAFTSADPGTDPRAEPLSRHAFLFYCMCCGTVALFVMILVKKRLPTLFSYSLKTVARLVFTGVFGFFIYYLLLNWAFYLARAQNAVPEVMSINYLFPMCTLLASAAILREKLNLSGIISALICFVGVVIVATSARNEVSTGGAAETFSMTAPSLCHFLALGAAVSWGVFSALGRKWKHEFLTGMFVYALTGVVLSGIVFLSTSGRMIPVGWEYVRTVYVGVVCNTVGALLWFAALRRGGTLLVSNLVLLTAFVSLVYVWLLMGDQTIRWQAVTGLTVIILGILLSHTQAKPVAPISE